MTADVELNISCALKDVQKTTINASTHAWRKTPTAPSAVVAMNTVRQGAGNGSVLIS
jgi:hypothetical protein